MAKSIRKTIRFTEEEWSEISAQLEKAEIDFSTFCRNAILKKKIKLPIEKSLLSQISRIGNNLNQIARAVNREKKIQVLTQLVQIEKALKALQNGS